MQSSNRLWNAVQGEPISFGQDLVSSGEAMIIAMGTGNSRMEKCQEGKKKTHQTTLFRSFSVSGEE